MRITYKKSLPWRVVAFSDPSFAENKQSRTSVYGVIMLCAGVAASCFSRTQHFVTLSSHG